uniref:Cytidine and dCMP deaminase domain-containing protein 1 n=1 Tax=Oncorhynchus tshawytscha TaxID=74940 RepID=A0AAZ3SL04_ONCTS
MTLFMDIFKKWHSSCHSSIKARFVQYTTDCCPMDRVSHLSCRSLQFIQSDHGPLGCISDQGTASISDLPGVLVSCLSSPAGVSRISFWPGDPEMSLLVVRPNGTDSISQEAMRDAIASEKLKSNSQPHISVVVQPVAPGLQQFVEETSRGCDFMERVSVDDPELDAGDFYRKQRRRNLDTFSEEFLIPHEQCHRDILTKIGLENFCTEPYFSNLRQNMRELVGVLASVAASVPLLQHGFYKKDSQPATSEQPQPQGVSQEIARHCIVQARLLAYRTARLLIQTRNSFCKGDMSPHFGGCDGTGRLYLVGCGYKAYPVGSEYGQYPQMDTKQQDRQRRKYRYIIHAEQNALTFRSDEIREEENTMLFVTKCPCDECVPLIRGAGIKQIYTTDLDSGKDKGDISYLRFHGLQGVLKFIPFNPIRGYGRQQIQTFLLFVEQWYL